MGAENEFLLKFQTPLRRGKNRGGHTTRHNVATFPVTPAKALGLKPQIHAFVALDTGFRRYDDACVV
ncbi:hypothetical protein [Thermopetrobacter sp. TC1]|uniref:hypothetical protein n=1 Tax=Thermopetrobacter sp. TC1 TaxID=1495045 RepID=UPI0012E03F31|nr:hypothetical protein [Thermopetrobacter sp. TC1]